MKQWRFRFDPDLYEARDAYGTKIQRSPASLASWLLLSCLAWRLQAIGGPGVHGGKWWRGEYFGAAMGQRGPTLTRSAGELAAGNPERPAFDIVRIVMWLTGKSILRLHRPSTEAVVLSWSEPVVSPVSQRGGAVMMDGIAAMAARR